jgi:hypothetical protein
MNRRELGRARVPPCTWLRSPAWPATQARLHHPRILPPLEPGSTGERLYYTMPFVEQGSTSDRKISCSRRLGTRSWQTSASRTPSRAVVETSPAAIGSPRPASLWALPAYMSPEQPAGDEVVDGHTDQYALTNRHIEPMHPRRPPIAAGGRGSRPIDWPYSSQGRRHVGCRPPAPSLRAPGNLA